MQLSFYFDQTRCTGCFTCVVACKDWHDIPAGPVSWRRVTTTEKGRFPNVSVSFLSTSCLHCADPACAKACPVNAITKRKQDGIVVVDREACLGAKSCGSPCQTACPYGIPQFEADHDAKMQMCNLCYDRWAEGKKPICVQSCPMRALDAGPLDEMEAQYGKTREVEGFEFTEVTKPSIVFKAKK
jgi:anaerobic dimethyl sulfoxide reductase subunit B (iron-sulfur subunit)